MELNVRWDAEIYLSTIYSHCTFAVDIYFNNLSLSVASYSSAGHSLHQSHRSDKFTFNWYSRRTHFRAHLFRSHHLIVSEIDNLFLTWCLICSMDWSILFVRFFLVSLHQIGQSVLAFQMGYWNLHSTHSTYFAVLSNNKTHGMISGETTFHIWFWWVEVLGIDWNYTSWKVGHVCQPLQIMSASELRISVPYFEIEI